MTLTDEQKNGASSNFMALAEKNAGHRLGRAEFVTDDLVPDGPFRMRLLGTTYETVSKSQLVHLRDMGLLVGAEFWQKPGWVSFGGHPEFEELRAVLVSEVKMVMRASGTSKTPRPFKDLPADGSDFDEITRQHYCAELVEESSPSEATSTKGESKTSDRFEEDAGTVEIEPEEANTMFSDFSEREASEAEFQRASSELDESSSSVEVLDDFWAVDSEASAAVDGLFDGQADEGWDATELSNEEFVEEPPPAPDVDPDVSEAPRTFKKMPGEMTVVPNGFVRILQPPRLPETAFARALAVVAAVVLGASAGFVIGWWIV